MMKKIFSFVIVAIVAAIACCFTSCEKESEKEHASGIITFYGTVVDKTTGEPLWNATVSCGGARALTGQDGTYQFDVHVAGYHFKDSYTYKIVISVEKKGYYNDTFGHYCQEIEFGKRVKIDFALGPS